MSEHTTGTPDAIASSGGGAHPSPGEERILDPGVNHRHPLRGDPEGTAELHPRPLRDRYHRLRPPHGSPEEEAKPLPFPPRKAKQRREHGDVVDTCDIAPRYGPRDVVAGKGEEGYLPRHRRENPGLPEQVPRGHGTVRQESDPDTGGAMLRLERLPERR